VQHEIANNPGNIKNFILAKFKIRKEKKEEKKKRRREEKKML